MSEENEKKVYNKECALLALKLAQITRELGSVPEDSTHEYDRYSYTSYKALNAKIRPLLEKFKVFILPSIVNLWQESQEVNGKFWVKSRVEMNFTIIDCETGYSEKIPFYGEDRDTKGKSLAQAVTACQKQFEMKLFHVSIYSDEDEGSPTITESELRNTQKNTQAENNKQENQDKPTVTKEDVVRKLFQVSFLKSETEFNDLGKLNEKIKAELGKSIPQLTVEECKKILEDFSLAFDPSDENLNMVVSSLNISKSDALKMFIDAMSGGTQ